MITIYQSYGVSKRARLFFLPFETLDINFMGLYATADECELGVVSRES